MYYYFNGFVVSKSKDYIILDVNNVGYKIYVKSSIDVKVNDQVKLYLYEKYSETGITLYGFISEDDLNLFEKLITVRKIGPKNAQSILAIGNNNDIIDAIQDGNVNFLAKAQGVSLKLAQNIVEDLRGKFKSNNKDFINNKEIDLINALTSLGYEKSEILNIITKLDTKKELTELMYDAVKLLSK